MHEPGYPCIAPWREWNLTRVKRYFHIVNNTAFRLNKTRGKSIYQWTPIHISYEGAVLEDPWTEPEEDMWRWSKFQRWPPIEARKSLGFEKGDPVSINDQSMSPQFACRTSTIGGRHGVGRLDIVENRHVG